MDEQLAQVLDIIPNVVPENKDDLFIFILEYFSAYIFMLIKIPNKIDEILVKINPVKASSGK